MRLVRARAAWRPLTTASLGDRPRAPDSGAPETPAARCLDRALSWPWGSCRSGRCPEVTTPLRPHGLGQQSLLRAPRPRRLRSATRRPQFRCLLIKKKIASGSTAIQRTDPAALMENCCRDPDLRRRETHCPLYPEQGSVSAFRQRGTVSRPKNRIRVCPAPAGGGEPAPHPLS